jgi:hypothetical protein
LAWHSHGTPPTSNASAGNSCCCYFSPATERGAPRLAPVTCRCRARHACVTPTRGRRRRRAQPMSNRSPMSQAPERPWACGLKPLEQLCARVPPYNRPMNSVKSYGTEIRAKAIHDSCTPYNRPMNLVKTYGPQIRAKAIRVALPRSMVSNFS